MGFTPQSAQKRLSLCETSVSHSKTGKEGTPLTKRKSLDVDIVIAPTESTSEESDEDNTSATELTAWRADATRLHLTLVEAFGAPLEHGEESVHLVEVSHFEVRGLSTKVVGPIKRLSGASATCIKSIEQGSMWSVQDCVNPPTDACLSRK